MARWTIGAATLAWLLGRVVLGTQWGAVESAPGVWQDAISLRQWALLWALLAVLAVAVATVVPRWTHRLLALVPLLAWIGWSLRGGTLWPIALAIYGTPTVLAWCGGLLMRDARWRR